MKSFIAAMIAFTCQGIKISTESMATQGTCPADAFDWDGFCYCNDYVAKEYDGGSNACVCLENLVPDGEGSCKPSIECPEGSSFDRPDNECVCHDGDLTWNAETNTCEGEAPEQKQEELDLA